MCPPQSLVELAARHRRGQRNSRTLLHVKEVRDLLKLLDVMHHLCKSPLWTLFTLYFSRRCQLAVVIWLEGTNRARAAITMLVTTSPLSALFARLLFRRWKFFYGRVRVVWVALRVPVFVAIEPQVGHFSLTIDALAAN